MRITVFGASGMVGQLATRLALRDGHEVRAFVHSRNPFPRQRGLCVVAGTVTHDSAVAEAICGSEAVISALGSRAAPNKDVLTTGMRTVIPAMRRSGVHRLVTLTGAGGTYPADIPDLRLRMNRAALRIWDSAVLADGEAHLRILQDSGMDWTSVRAPLIRAGGTHGYRLSSTMPTLLTTVPGPAVARCLVDLAVSPSFIRQAPGIHRQRSAESTT